MKKHTIQSLNKLPMADKPLKKTYKTRERNLIIRENSIIYNTLRLYDDNTTFRLPDYIITAMSGTKRILYIKYNGDVISIYNHHELIQNMVSISHETYDGNNNGKEIKYNLAIITLKPLGSDKNNK